MKKNGKEKRNCTTTDDLRSSSVGDFHLGTSEIQILLTFTKYISSNSAFVSVAALLVSVTRNVLLLTLCFKLILVLESSMSMTGVGR